MSEKITGKGIAVLLICGATPLMRLLIGGSGLLTWVLLPAIVLMFLSIKDYRFISGLQLKVMLISLWLMISTIYSPVATSVSLENAKVQICTVLVFFYFINKKEKNILIILSFAAALFFIYCYFFSSDFYMGGIRKYILLQGTTWLDPNMVIASFIIPCIWAVWYLVLGKNWFLKALMVFFLGLSLYGSFLGASRGGLIAIVIGIIVLLYRELNLSRKHVVSIIGMIIIFAALLGIVKSYVPENLLNRMTLASVNETGGSGRFDIYETYLSRFFNESNLIRVLFGYGKESCKLILGKSSHNILIDYLWDLGVMGVVFHLFTIISIAKYCIASKNTLSITCLIATMVWSLTISTSDQLLYWVLLYSCVCFAHNAYHAEVDTVDDEQKVGLCI